MRRQSNAPLYVLGGCVVVIAIIVALVRANAPKDEEKKPSVLSNLRLSLGAPSSASAQALMPGPVGSNHPDRVQMLPITVEGKQGLLVRYEADVLVEPVQQRVALNIMNEVRHQAGEAGVEYVVIMAIGPGGGPGSPHSGGPPLAAQTLTIVYQRLVDGSWVKVEDPAPVPGGSASAGASGAVHDPRSAGSASKPASSNVPLVIER